MTASAPSLACPDCRTEVAPGLLSCPGCSRLVHRDALTRLAAAADAAEKAGDLSVALASWRSALELLPQNTVQHATIHKRMQSLAAALDGRGTLPPGVGPTPHADKATGRTGLLAGLGTLGVILLKSKTLLVALLSHTKLLLVGLTKLPTLVSMLIYARWSAGSGLAVGLGLVASIYVHEVGHVAALRRYGIDASAPMFIPGLGALVRLKQYPTDAHEEARTGLAGPLWGLVAALVAAVVGKLFSSEAALTVASLGASINLFNLIPVWQLDGARGLRALAKQERILVGSLGLCVGALLHQWMPTIVGSVALVRAFGKDEGHPTGDKRVLWLFAALIVAFALIGRV